MKIGPGRLVLVVGPSGAGKDTLIAAARLACEGDANVVFPRRVVTRQAAAAEQHDTLDAETFERAASSGAFALWWGAHGNRYGIPVSMDVAIRRGHTIVCNVSRTIVEEARNRYAAVVVVLVTAPDPVLRLRLTSRGRPSDGDIGARIGRSNGLGCEPDFVIHNIGTPEQGARRLVAIIRRRSFTGRRPARSESTRRF